VFDREKDEPVEGAAHTHDQYTDQVLLLGICSDSNSSFMQGPAASPPLHSPSSNLTSETGVSSDGHGCGQAG
jgi:hypothetical protein